MVFFPLTIYYYPSCLNFKYLSSTDYRGVEVLCCAAHPLTHQLVLNGFFPASPVKPRMAVSIHLLDFYFSLLERSGDAVTAMSAALRTFYSRRGFPIIDDSVWQPVSSYSPRVLLLL